MLPMFVQVFVHVSKIWCQSQEPPSLSFFMQKFHPIQPSLQWRRFRMLPSLCFSLCRCGLPVPS